MRNPTNPVEDANAFHRIWLFIDSIRITNEIAHKIRVSQKAIFAFDGLLIAFCIVIVIDWNKLVTAVSNFYGFIGEICD